MKNNGEVLRKIYSHVNLVATDVKYDKNFKEKYGGLCRRFPALLHNNGLAQSIAFCRSKGEGNSKFEFYKKFLNDLGGTLDLDLQKQSSLEFELAKRWDDIYGMNDISLYQLLTRRTFHAANWYKRYAEILLPSADQEKEASVNA